MFWNKNTQAGNEGGNSTTTEGGEPNATAGAKGNETVPMWKLTKTAEKAKEVENKLKEAESKLRAFEEAEKKKKDDEALAKGEYEKLIQSEREEKNRVLSEKQALEERVARERLEAKALKEILKFAPNDPEDVLRFVDITTLSIDDSGHVANLKESVEKLKTEKPYLFGKTSNSANPDENGRPAAGAEALKAAEMEYKQLLSKSQTQGQSLTPDEIRRMRILRMDQVKNKK